MAKPTSIWMNCFVTLQISLEEKLVVMAGLVDLVDLADLADMVSQWITVVLILVYPSVFPSWMALMDVRRLVKGESNE